MPYIKQDLRDQLDPELNRLIDKIKSLAPDKSPSVAGLLNYSCSRLAIGTIPERRYWCIALISGALHNVAEEFYRRYASKYEDEAISTNGDIYE